MNTVWENIIGHNSNIVKLKQMVAENRLPHALLFVGIAGIGKTMIAETLSTLILCHNSHDGIPCGICSACQGMKNGTHPDFHRVIPMTKNEFDGKKETSNTAKRIIRIEQIRELQEKVSRVPVLSERSVAILEDVEAMNEQAANAILKTIEEPEAPVTFILLTSSPAFLLDTIRSRCMRMEFGILSPDEISRYLQKQGISSVEQGRLSALADGSIGRAMELREPRPQELRQWAESLLMELPRMTNEAVWKRGEKIEKMTRDELSEALTFFAMYLRDMLVLYSGSGTGLYNQQDAGKLTNLMREFSSSRIDAMLRLVLACQYRLRYNVNLRLTIEAFLMRLKKLK